VFAGYALGNISPLGSLPFLLSPLVIGLTALIAILVWRLNSDVTLSDARIISAVVLAVVDVAWGVLVLYTILIFR